MSKLKKAGFKAKRKKVNMLRLALLVVIGVVVAYFVSSAVRIINLNNERNEVTEKNRRLKEQAEDLKQQLEIVNTDSYMEGLARKRLRLVHSNEILFVLPDIRMNEEDEAVGPTDIALEEAQKLVDEKDADKTAGEDADKAEGDKDAEESKDAEKADAEG